MTSPLVEDGEVHVREPVGLDTLKEPPGRRGIGDIGGLQLTRTAGQHAADTATYVGDNRTRIARCREDAQLVDYTSLYGDLVDVHIKLEIVANNEEDAVRSADGGVRGIAGFDHEQARFPASVPHVRGMHQSVCNDALEWKHTISGILEGPVDVAAGETFDREVNGLYVRS